LSRAWAREACTRTLRFIRLERAETEEAKALLAAHHLTFDAEMHDEGYVIVPDGKGGLAVIAETSAQGIFYGAQTVKQLMRGTGKDAVLLAPTLRDWPAMAHRGLSDDWSRGPLPNMDFLEARDSHAGGLQVQHSFAVLSSTRLLTRARRWRRFRAGR
jgi:hypothetical protein